MATNTVSPDDAASDTVANDATLEVVELPSVCDYLVVGGGATGMAFVDSFVHANKDRQKLPISIDLQKIHIVMLDEHAAPGGQWNDSYDFVRLHQPSSGYGVETMTLEEKNDDDDAKEEHRATRLEILEYYQKVCEKLKENVNVEFLFVGNTRLLGLAEGDLDKERINFDCLSRSGVCQSIVVRKRMVDARYLQPDLPIHVKPKFEVADNIRCVPVNELVAASSTGEAQKYYVIIGGGKTGMDAVYYLLQEQKVPPSHIVWIMPHHPWITARENFGNCMEFLHTAVTTDGADWKSEKILQGAFLEWEKQGKIYRLDPTVLPTKFQDATLDKAELSILRTMLETNNVIVGKGRVAKIAPNGDLIMDKNDETIELPWKSDDSVQSTTFVHCSAGAFNYSHQVGYEPVPVFSRHRIVIQDVYGTPGFCFVGSIVGKLESLYRLSDKQRNEMLVAPKPPKTARNPLGPSGGDVVKLSMDHNLVHRLLNLKGWLSVPELRTWLVGHRLFNMGHKSVEEMDVLVSETWEAIDGKLL